MGGAATGEGGRVNVVLEVGGKGGLSMCVIFCLHGYDTSCMRMGNSLLPTYMQLLCNTLSSVLHNAMVYCKWDRKISALHRSIGMTMRIAIEGVRTSGL